MIALNTAVRNEADRIIGMLTDAATYCDELVVVDCESDDGTAELARDFGALVLSDTDYGYCEPNRELASRHTRSAWIVVLDADELLLPDAVEEMKQASRTHQAVRFARCSTVEGRCIDPPQPDGTPHPDFQLRAFAAEGE